MKRFLFLLLMGPAAWAVQPNSLFTDHAVFQQGVPLPVWGKGAPGEKVSVSLAGHTAGAITGEDGKWRVQLPAMQPGGPLAMSISGTNTVQVQDVYVGEVWIASGQSNMERQLGPRPPQKPIDNWRQEAASGDLPQVRQYYVPEHLTSSGTNDDASGGWVVCTPKTATSFTAVGFFFARALHKALHVPVGIVFTAWGGTTAESWTSIEALRSRPELAEIVAKHESYVAGYPAALEQFNKNLELAKAKYSQEVIAAAMAGKPAPTPFKAPAPPKRPETVAPARLFNAMVAPLIPFPVKGALWYQGESNGGRGWQYRTLLPTMIADWRARWGEGDLPFLIVQIAPYGKSDPAIREAQLLTVENTPATALAPTLGLGDVTDIHPPHKRPVGERLALAARALAYGAKVEYSGPLFESSAIEGGKVIAGFSHAAGLSVTGGTGAGFVIAGGDGKFVPASAEVSGTTVVISSPEVVAPAAARYGFAAMPEPSLVNSAGLPASPFRTDWQKPIAPPLAPNPAPAAHTDGTSPATLPAR